MNKLLVGFDTETTGKDPATAEVVQLAAVSMCPETFDINVLFNQTSYPTTGVLPKEASEVHGLYLKQLVYQPRDPWSVKAFVSLLDSLIDHDIFLVTYNGESYDVPVIAKLEKNINNYKHIDVYRIVQRTPELFKHGLSLGDVYEGVTQEVLGGAHEAVVDVIGTFQVMKHAMELLDMGAGELHAWLEVPQVLEVCYFGKHKGKLFKDIPAGYLSWVKKNWTDIPPDLMATINEYA